MVTNYVTKKYNLRQELAKSINKGLAVDVDDVAEKTRRNLVLFSTGIIIISILGLPLDGKLLGAVDLKNVDPARAWLCALAMLLYLALRFYLTPAYAEGRSKWALARFQAFEQGLIRAVEDAITTLPADGTKNGISVNFPVRPGRNFRAEPMYEHELLAIDQNRAGTVTVGWLAIAEEVKDAPTSYARIGHSAQFRVSRLKLCQLHLRAAAAQSKLSWELLEYALPYGLTTIAAWICGVRLGQHIL